MKTKFLVNLTEHQKAELLTLSAAHGRTMSSLVREGVNAVIGDLGGTVEADGEDESKVYVTLSARVLLLEQMVGELRGRVA